jgi:hypothetical protein
MSNLNPQQFLYHVSPAYNKESILSQGLDPHQESHDWGSAIKKRVYMTPSEEQAHSWATQVELTHGKETPMSLFKVDVAGMRPRRKMTDMGLHEYSTPHPIEPSRVSHVKDFMP